MTATVAATHRFTVLIISEAPMMRRLLVNTLGRDEYVFVEAPNIADALRVAAQRKPDLVLFALESDQSGAAIAHRFQHMANIPRTPVIVLTSQGGQDGAVPVCGATKPIERISRPFSPLNLLLSVRRMLGGDLGALNDYSAPATVGRTRLPA